MDLNAVQYQKFLLHAVQNAQTEIFWLNTSGKIIFANESAFTNNHYQQEEILKLDYSHLDNYVSQGTWPKFLDALQLNEKMRYETIFQNKYGEKKPVEISANFYKIDNFEFIVLNCQNITKRKKAEQLLKINEEKFRLFTEINRDAIIQLDRNGIIKYCSPIFFKLYGYKPGDVHKASFFKFLGKEDSDILKSEFQNIFSGNELAIREVEIYNAQKNAIDAEVTILPFKREDRIIGFHLVLRDITEKIKRENELDQVLLKYENIIMESEVLNDNLAKEIKERKKIEKELLKARQEAINANNAKSEFLANMSHEIRTPLNAVLGFAEILKEKLNTFPEYEQYIEGINTGGKSLLSLINDILDLSKIEAGRLEIQKEPVSIQQLFKEVSQIFKNKIENKGLELIIDVDSNIPDMVEIDHTRMRQILVNLVGNAVKFTAQGSITTSARVIQKNKDNLLDLEFIVKDTGLGIPRMQQKIIFDPFKQKEGQSTRKYGGTGLGLTITKRLAEMMNGSVSVESRINKGASFIVLLKNVSVSEEELNLTVSNENNWEHHDFMPAKILLVEDNILNRQVFKGYLEKQPFEIIETTNGQEALDVLKTTKPDIIFMDMLMPVMEGIETTQIIRSSIHLKYLPVIALSASMVKNYSNNEVKLFDDLLLKPVSKKELIISLSNYLDYKEGKQQSKDQDLTDNSKSKIDLSEIILSDSQKAILRKRYKSQLKSIISELVEFIDIEAAKLLASDLTELGNETAIKPMVMVGDKLLLDSKQFKINEIETTIEQIQTFFKNIK